MINFWELFVEYHLEDPVSIKDDVPQAELEHSLPPFHKHSPSDTIVQLRICL